MVKKLFLGLFLSGLLISNVRASDDSLTPDEAANRVFSFVVNDLASTVQQLSRVTKDLNKDFIASALFDCQFDLQQLQDLRGFVQDFSDFGTQVIMTFRPILKQSAGAISARLRDLDEDYYDNGSCDCSCNEDGPEQLEQFALERDVAFQPLLVKFVQLRAKWQTRTDAMYNKVAGKVARLHRVGSDRARLHAEMIVGIGQELPNVRVVEMYELYQQIGQQCFVDKGFEREFIGVLRAQLGLHAGQLIDMFDAHAIDFWQASSDLLVEAIDEVIGRVQWSTGNCIPPTDNLPTKN